MQSSLTTLIWTPLLPMADASFLFSPRNIVRVERVAKRRPCFGYKSRPMAALENPKHITKPFCAIDTLIHAFARI